MSDFILKIFPAHEVADDKTELIKQALLNNKFLRPETLDFCGDTHFKPGDSFCDYFEFEDTGSATNSYEKEVTIKITADGYGVIVEEDAEDPEFVDRKNVLEIWNVDGNYKRWDKLTELMQQATGDIYLGEWEIL